MQKEYRGVFTAMTTPFTSSGEVDYPAIERFIEFQIANGVQGLVPVGTTGECPTLSTREHIEVVDFVCRKANGRVIIIAGTGSNSTTEAIELTHMARESGADATLQVSPYYNKPSQEGLFRHMAQISEKGGLPIVLYNIPGRTGITMELNTLERMCKAFPVAALKEAAGSVEQVSRIHERLPELPILSGDDALTLPMISCGACGVVSVASNLIPGELVRMVQYINDGNLPLAKAIHEKYHALFNDLFIETNPVPVKAALAMMGFALENYRLPLCEMTLPHHDLLKETLRKCGILTD